MILKYSDARAQDRIKLTSLALNPLSFAIIVKRAFSGQLNFGLRAYMLGQTK